MMSIVTVECKTLAVGNKNEIQYNEGRVDIPETEENLCFGFLFLFLFFFSKEKEKLMGEIQKRAQLLKKQQEAQGALKAKIKVG